MLNVAYKIVAKVLQWRLQPLLADVISEDQTSFLPMKYILDNVLVTHETITWAKETDQDMILLKLDFMKAYDTVNLSFLWEVMTALGVPPNFTQLCKLLFEGAEASVNVNGGETKRFPVT